jgi:glutamine---fructose-6-phosphate transaminase (isomerizing)
VLQGYRGRYAALKDAVTETEPTFDDARLADVDVVDLLTEPVYVLAERWRTR